MIITGLVRKIQTFDQINMPKKYFNVYQIGQVVDPHFSQRGSPLIDDEGEDGHFREAAKWAMLQRATPMS